MSIFSFTTSAWLGGRASKRCDSGKSFRVPRGHGVDITILSNLAVFVRRNHAPIALRLGALKGAYGLIQLGIGQAIFPLQITIQNSGA
jgi:hypothetical protein